MISAMASRRATLYVDHDCRADMAARVEHLRSTEAEEMTA
jgi:hypothetical protein